MQVFIIGKSTDPSAIMYTSVDFATVDYDSSNLLDDAVYPMTVSDLVEIVYPDMTQHGEYCRSNITTASWVKELGQYVNFCV